ncbi:MAG: hypothetical protein AAGJ50_14035 [Pseudomonadota bacterium]
MTIRTQFALTFVAAALAACGTVGATNTEDAGPAVLSEDAQKTLARFEPTGETVACVPTRRIRDMKPLSDDLLLVRVGATGYYLNRPASTCKNSTNISNSLFYDIDGVPNLCSGEIVNVVSNRPGTVGLVQGGCSLGTFEEVKLKTET